MRVLFDHQVFSFFSYGGILRYYDALINRFLADSELKLSISAKYARSQQLSFLQNNRAILSPMLQRYSLKGILKIPASFYNGLIVKPTNYVFQTLNKYHSVASLKLKNYDVFHPTYYNPYFTHYLNDKPFVLTVHDLIHEKFPHYYQTQRYIPQWKELLLKKATAIIAISNYTKQDIIKYYNIAPERITVIYHANCLNPRLSSSIPTPIHVPRRYILYVGDRQGYKNFSFFLTSISKLLRLDPTLHVLCAGSKPFTQEEHALISRLRIEKQVHHVPIENDSQLVFMYKNALVFVFPSLSEGFGFPVLEAFSCGCPVIVSNEGALPEIAGNACIIFDARNSESLVEAVKQVLDNEDIRISLREAGFLRERDFSWDRTARETKQVYKNIMQTTN
ncbi:MAG: glycosyltransferase family 4 protein [Bacteroidetes bacterium]|nr:glycosyltransferase family 4 protein [Bacteroidota bacterium]